MGRVPGGWLSAGYLAYAGFTSESDPAFHSFSRRDHWRQLKHWIISRCVTLQAQWMTIMAPRLPYPLPEIGRGWSKDPLAFGPAEWFKLAICVILYHVPLAINHSSPCCRGGGFDLNALCLLLAFNYIYLASNCPEWNNFPVPCGRNWMKAFKFEELNFSVKSFNLIHHIPFLGRRASPFIAEINCDLKGGQCQTAENLFLILAIDPITTSALFSSELWTAADVRCSMRPALRCPLKGT